MASLYFMCMQAIATLGPSNTFSELAAQYYTSILGGRHSVKLYPTLSKAFAAVGNECEYGILPIENMTEGYVSVILDLLVHTNLQIVDELLLPIQFSLVANCSSLEEIERIYAQFVTQGQCERFLDNLDDTSIITTQSNGISLEQALKGIPYEAAIVPAYSVKPDDFPLVRANIADFANNQTRFIVLGKNSVRCEQNRPWKTSILIFETVDRPGVLSGILNAFATRSVNLMSIISRPTKEMLGRYHFFIDIDGRRDSGPVQEAFQEIGNQNAIKMLGTYPRAETPIDLKTILSARSKTKHKQGSTDFSLGTSPLYKTGEKPRVFVSCGAEPYEVTTQALANVDLTPVCGKRVLLKPNAGRAAAPESGIVTHPEVVAAVIDAFKKAGAEVALGESPVAGVSTREAFEKSGIAAVAKARNCKCIDMDSRRFVRVEIPQGQAIHNLKVCPDVFDFDIVVSIPVMKTHMHTGVTLSVKNMKGCLWRRSKVDLHMLPELPGCDDRPLNIAIADMASVLKPHFAVIDGTIGMEGLGPSAGQPKNFGAVVVSSDPFAADAVACTLMGIDPLTIPHLRISAERGYGSLDCDDFDISPSGWQEIIRPFAAPPENLSIAFEGVEVLDSKSCSACQSTLLLFLKRYGNKIYREKGPGNQLRIAIGKGHDKLPENTICIGNCTARFKKDRVHVTGCPPVASEILKTYAEYIDKIE